MTALALPQFAARQTAPPRRAADERRLIDSHGRTIRDLRISLTDRCNFRCRYCMEPDVRFAPSDALLTSREIVRTARVAVGLGVQKIRLTGGEPMLRLDLLDIITALRTRSPEIELAMTTNGAQINAAAARALAGAGLDRVTISLDTLHPDRFTRLTRSTGSPAQVIAAIRHCIDAGLTPVKVNAVLLRGVNDDEAPDLAALARELDIDIRFIEYMPLDSGHHWDQAAWVSADETRAAIEEHHPLVACDAADASQTARTYRFADGPSGRIGFIAPISQPFCGACSRLRITADGKVRPCLFSKQEWDIRTLLRAEANDRTIEDFLMNATWTKQPGHGITSPDFEQPARPMSAIGG